MHRAKFQGKDLKIAKRSGPFGLRPLKTKELFDLTQSFQDDKKSIAENYLKIVQQCLVYEKSKKNVYQPSQIEKMDEELGGGVIVELGNQAMVVNGLMDAADLDSRVEDAEKN